MQTHAKSCLQGCSGEADTNWGGCYYCDLKFGPNLLLQKVLKQTGFGPWRGGFITATPFCMVNPDFNIATLFWQEFGLSNEMN